MNWDDIKSQFKGMFGSGTEGQPYLVGTDLAHCHEYIKHNYNPNVIKHNVLAVHKMGFVMLFNIQHPSREVDCFSFGNGVQCKRDIVEVFNMIQNTCVAWCEV